MASLGGMHLYRRRIGQEVQMRKAGRAEGRELGYACWFLDVSLDFGLVVASLKTTGHLAPEDSGL